MVWKRGGEDRGPPIARFTDRCAPVFKVLSDAGYQGWLLVEAEQDPAKANPLEYAIKGRTYIREHTGL